MKRIKILGIFLSLVLALVLASSIQALAKLKPSEVHYGSMGMTTWFSPPDHPDMMIEVLDIKRSPFGPYDFLSITIFPNVTVIITDNNDIADFIDDVMGGGMNITTRVQDDELEVWRKGKTLFAELTMADGPVDNLSIVFKGIGGAESGTETEEMPGVTMTAKYMGFYAFVTVVAHVGTPAECEQMTLGVLATQMRMILTVTPL